MNEMVGRWPGAALIEDDARARDLAERLERSAPRAFRVAYAVLRRREDAEDVAQEALTKAFRSFRALRDLERFEAWLVRITWRRALDRFEAWLVRITWRRALDRRRSEIRRTRYETAALERPAPASPEDLAASGETEMRIWAEMDRLPDKLRIVLVLAGIEGHDLAAVSRLLEVPVGTVKSRLFHARRAMAERLR